MPKVLHVVAGISAESGGPTAALLAMLRMLAGSSAHCAVAVGRVDPRDEAVLGEIAGLVSLHSFPSERWSRFAYSAAFSRAIGPLVCEHDVLHVHSMWNWPTYCAARSAREAHVPVIFRPAGSLDRFDVQKHAAMKRVLGPLFLRRLFQAPNVFHCTASREAEQLVTYGGNAAREVLSLPVLAAAPVSLEARAQVRRKLGIAPDAPVAIFLSRLNYKKGLDILIPALAKARETEPSLQLIVAGDGEADVKEMVGSLIAQHGLQTAVHCVGFVAGAEKAALLAASDVSVLPSQNENFGVSVVEALAAGLPVVATPGVYILDELGGNDAIAKCDRSIVAVAGGLLRMVTRARHDSVGLGLAAKTAWAEHFSPTLLRPRYEALYARTARARPFA